MKKKKNKKRYDSEKTQPVNRRHKDRLFRFAFQDKKDLLELYNAVNGTDYPNPEDLIITTLEDAIYLGMKNDLSFIIGASLNLYEHQSTWNKNMPLRGLLYFASLYQEFVELNGYNLYGDNKIPLPFPQYLVFYNGDEEEPDRIELALSDSFQKERQDMAPCLECKVQVLNINQGHNRELMEKCHRLWEYAEFIGQIKANLQKGMSIHNAIHTAMSDCLNQGILANILARCQTEVLTMLLTEYDEKKTRDYLRKEALELGREEGEESAFRRINELNQQLIEAGRYEDLKRTSVDRAYQRKLLQEFNI